jgi:hypothetical protein
VTEHHYNPSPYAESLVTRHQCAVTHLTARRGGWPLDEERARESTDELYWILKAPDTRPETKVVAYRALLEASKFASKEELDQARFELDRQLGEKTTDATVDAFRAIHAAFSADPAGGPVRGEGDGGGGL